MRSLFPALFVAVLALPAAAGGKRCQVAESAVPTPGLQAMAMTSSADPAPDEVRLTDEQVERLAAADTSIRRALRDIADRRAKLPAGTFSETEAAGKALPDLVALFLSRSLRDAAMVIDADTANELSLADKSAMEHWRKGDKNERFCDLCVGVRRGLEAAFAWLPGEFGELSAEQEKEAADLAVRRQELRQKWVAALKAELTGKQLEWLREAQMQSLKKTVRDSVTAGMRQLGAAACESCSDGKGAKKCEFCGIVMQAVAAAKKPAER